MANELVSVSLCGDQVQAVQREGYVWAGLKCMCDLLSLDFSAQLKRLKKQRWATMAMIATVAGDKKERETVVLRSDKIPMWLVTVERSRIKDATIREKIDLYQDQAADVLARHFMPKSVPNATTEVARQLELVRGELVQMQNRIDAMQSATVETAQAVVQRAISDGAVSAAGPRLPGPFWTVASWLEENMPEWNATPDQRHAIGQDAKRRVMRACPGERVGYFNRDLAFVAHQEYYLARSAQRTRQKAEREGKAQTFGLFANDDTAKAG